MTELWPELERQLRAAVRAGRVRAPLDDEQPAVSRSGWRSLLDPGRVAATMGVLVALVVAGAALVLGSGGRPASPGVAPARGGFSPAAGCTHRAAAAGSLREAVAGRIDGRRWRLLVDRRRHGASAVQSGRFVLGGHGYGLCRDPLTIELIHAGPHAIVYGYIVGRDAAPVTVEAAAGPPAAKPRAASRYPASIRLIGGGTFFVRALPASACRYRGLALATARVTAAASSAVLYFAAGFGRCRAGQLVAQPSPRGSSPSARPATCTQRLMTDLGVLRRPQTARDRAFHPPKRPGSPAAQTVAPAFTYTLVPGLTRLARTLPDGSRVFLAAYAPSPGGPAAALGDLVGVFVVRAGHPPAMDAEVWALTLESSGQLPPQRSGDSLFSVVPSQVARVTWTFPRARLPHLPHTPALPALAGGTVSADVRGNIAAARALPDSWPLPTVTRWYNAGGRVIRTFREPAPRLSRPRPGQQTALARGVVVGTASPTTGACRTR